MAGRKSKKQKILDEALQHKEFERMRIIEILKSLGKFTPALNSLIEMYLDACEVYHIKYLEWKDSGFKSTKVHTNKNGSRNEIKHPLAQQVEVWSEKKTKLLNQLGLDMKSGGLDYVDPLASENAKKKEEAKKDEPQTNNRLVEFRKMRGGQS
ncbi:P27 family phage terminase small subunit [Enterococcus faecalis]|nr:P27 family phage terminase small subunit [Enterococcus faecalis]